MTEQEKQLAQAAVRWVRKPANKKVVIEKFASPNKYSPSEYPMLFFTAGSPGAGKTEFIRGFKESIKRSLAIKPVVIDPDAARELLPGYTGSNSYLFQRAISIVVDDLFRHVLQNGQSAFIDGTLSDFDRAQANIEKVIKQYKIATIFYVFQHPTIAWRFTQLRETVEGRNIKKEDFIDRFIDAKETVNKIKASFGDKVILNVILKDYKDTQQNKAVAEVFNDVNSVDNCIEFPYTKADIKRILNHESVQ